MDVLNVSDLTHKPGIWLCENAEQGVVISSRMRLARNLDGAAFPGWAGEDECAKTCERIRHACERLRLGSPVSFLDMGGVGAVDKEVLQERHLISADLADKGRGSGLVLAHDESVSIMVNEEDHLRLQAMGPGLDLESLWRTLDAVDTTLEEALEYAASPDLGYLTACPSNVGTGLRASAMLHLSGLRLIGEVESVVNGLTRIGLTVRGLLGEGTEASGNMYQISNQSSLGESEEEIVTRLLRIVDEVVRHEQNARARLMENRAEYVLDHVARAYGILTHARVLASSETIDLLSALRLGVELDMVAGLSLRRLNEILLCTQPGHMQKEAGRALDPRERDARRAERVRAGLRRVRVTG